MKAALAAAVVVFCAGISSAQEILPRWLRLGMEWRGRAEFSLDPAADLDDRIYLNRTRLNATVEPSRLLRFVFQGQDARALSIRSGGDARPWRNGLDVRQGYMELGEAESGWQMRVGRQELSIGDERLLGADNYWDAFGRTFDAVRLGWRRGEQQVSAFAGYMVEPMERRRPDPFSKENSVAGLDWQRKVGSVNLEPFFIWRSSPGRDIATPGVRSTGELPHAVDYEIELAFQRGRTVSNAHAAWTGHWDVGWKPLGGDQRFAAEYTYASGDSNPNDERDGVFDDLYVSTFNRFGFADWISWRNISYPAITAEIPLNRRLTLNSGFQVFWLANKQDGLYIGDPDYFLRNPEAASNHVCNQLYVTAVLRVGENWRLASGYGRMFAGAWLRDSGFARRATNVFLQSSFSF